jgi:hypothetical protein
MVVQTEDALEAQRIRRQRWLERAGRELESAEGWQPARKPDALAAHLDRMVDISDKSDALTPTDKRDIRDRVRAIELKAYQHHIDFLLEQGMAVTRDKTRLAERGDLLRDINAALNVAIRLGMGEAIRQGIKDRLEIIMHTSAAGDSTAAKIAAAREAGQIEAVAHPKEQRRFTRWRKPPIIVMIAGRSFTSIDWSLGGALLEEVDDRGWRPGQPIDAKIKIADGKVHADKLEVVRYIAEGRRLAIRSRRFASVFMQLKRDCDAAGLEPV